MIIPGILFLLGLLCLIKGGDWFVDGASALARRFHLPELLIGATVVSIGTTLPEVMVSTISAVSGHGEISYGNAIGSVICNAALIAAITVAVRPGKVDPKTLRVPVAFFFAAAAIYCVAAYGMGRFTRPMGLLMLGMFVAYMAANVWQMKNAPAEPEHEEEPMGIGKIVLLLVVGAALIALGANLLVDNGTIIAQAMGVPESVIALTFVALGTSLPELVTAITSLMKGHSDLSLGNVVGANVFNLVLVSGMSVTLAPFEIPQSATLFGINSSLVLELPVMLLVMVLALLCAVVSILFCRGLHGVEHLLKRTLKNPYLRVAVGAAVLIGLTLLTNGDYNGAGMEVIGRAIAGQADPWAWVWKLLFTAITIGCGFKGGEVVPSFFVGAAFGCVAAGWLGLPAGFGAAMGLVSVFCGAVNCPLASIILSVELFGSGDLLYFAMACSISYLISGYCGLYSSQTILYSKLRAEFINVRTKE